MDTARLCICLPWLGLGAGRNTPPEHRHDWLAEARELVEVMGRQLVVNADDLGQHQGINEGIAEAVERGIVTSASLMVRWPAAEPAARWAAARPEGSIGIHLDLGEWVCQDGGWVPLYPVVDTDDAGVSAEVARQIDALGN